jgi:kojibiose phosphorylase
MWILEETSFEPGAQHHKETIFTTGNGYLSTRGAFEEGYPGDRRATFVHGVFDDVPISFTELANAPDWLPLTILLDGERFSLDSGRVESYRRELDLRTGVLTRSVRWRSPAGHSAWLKFERFASLADEHLLCLRCSITPEFEGEVEVRPALNAHMDNEGTAHWLWTGQGIVPEAGEGADPIYSLQTRTRRSGIELALAMRILTSQSPARSDFWDAQGVPTVNLHFAARAGETITVDKLTGIATSRDGATPGALAAEHARGAAGWEAALEAQRRAWAEEWERCDVEIEGDDEAQLAVRFSLFQLLIAAPRHDDRVNIGAKTLSGFGYRGHCFWDTEIFMLPVFIYTAPHIARNLLDYRHMRLPAAREKARANGYEGAQFPWESAATGEEVTPSWVPDFTNRGGLVRIWTGDIEIHISADIAYAAQLYWRASGDDAWFIERGAELVLDTAKFWASRAEWNAAEKRFEFRDVIGPDEYHDHVDNNFYTNYLARWNLRAALEALEWMKEHAPERAEELTGQLDLGAERLAQWREVIARIHLPVRADGLIEQFSGYFQRREVDLEALEPRQISVQALLGIEGASQTQVIKQPDVLMLQYLLRSEFSDAQVRMNYEYYSRRTDHTFGSSLGPAVQAIMACDVGQPEEAYEHFIRAARADLRDVRGNAQDGIHGASAGGTWQAVVFGFGGLRLTGERHSTQACLPRHWKRLAFRFMHRGRLERVELLNPDAERREVKGFIFDLDGVLTDTAEFHYRGWKRLADEAGIPFTREDNEALRGIPRRESLMRILGGRRYTEGEIQEMMERKNRYYLEYIQDITPEDLLPGARELLEEIRAAGLKSALGSASKNAPEVVRRLGIDGLLDAVAHGGTVAVQKPAPDLFLHAAEEMGLAPGKCVVVEDAGAGIEAARAGGFRSVGLGPRERVQGADVIYPSLEGLRLQDLLRALE